MPAFIDPKIYPRMLQNRITLTGILVTIIVFSLEVFLFGIEFLSSSQNLYLGILTYVVLPPFLFGGIGLILLGAFIQYKRIKKKGSPSYITPFRVDISIPSHRNTILVFFVGGFVLFMASLIGAYKGYHYTETNTFCGTLCHQVMMPEYTAYQNSTHARVKCVECHIGYGAGWYVKSKLSGMNQIYHAFKGDYPRPIPTPIKNLRPAQETCEQCHWPEKFFGAIEQRHDYYITDPEEDVDEWHLRMLINVGGGEEQRMGIHAHMNVNNSIYYVAADKRRQNIPWVKVVSKTGEVEIFNAKGSPFVDSTPPPHLVHKMDCMDCHNRPAHKFVPPYRSLNEALQFGLISKDIPEIKLKALELLEKQYTDKDSAVKHIRESLWAFYKKKYPDFYRDKSNLLIQAQDRIEAIYRDNFFPSMKVRWDQYPDNIGHLISKGCFRCHDGEHKSAAGESISRDCKACHAFLEQGPPDSLERSTDGLEFRHPVDIDDEWKDTNCSECHTGGQVD